MKRAKTILAIEQGKLRLEIKDFGKKPHKNSVTRQYPKGQRYQIGVIMDNKKHVAYSPTISEAVASMSKVSSRLIEDMVMEKLVEQCQS